MTLRDRFVLLLTKQKIATLSLWIFCLYSV